MNELEQLKAQLAELVARIDDFERNPIKYPASDLTKAALGVVTRSGAGSTALTQSISLSGNAQNISVPAAYAGTEVIDLGGFTREIPYVA